MEARLRTKPADVWLQAFDAAAIPAGPINTVDRVLSDPHYLVWDEWWGALRDSFPVLVGREAEAGRLRLHLGDVRMKRIGQVDLRWFADDLHVVAGLHIVPGPHVVAGLWDVAAPHDDAGAVRGSAVAAVRLAALQEGRDPDSSKLFYA